MTADVETMFSAREMPWHRQGSVTSTELLRESAIDEAGLGWTVRKVPLQAVVGSVELPNGDTIEQAVPVSDRVATVRSSDDSVLGIVGDGYSVFQNREMFRFVEALTGQTDVEYTTAGALKDGRVVWAALKLADENGGKRWERVVGDPVDMYLVVTTSHDGSRAFQALTTPVRPVCSNTLTWALQSANRTYSIRHTVNASINAHIDSAQETLGWTARRQEAIIDEIDSLVRVECSDDEFAAMLDIVFPDPHHRNDDPSDRQVANWQQRRSQAFAEYYAPENEPIRGTGWGAVNAVNGYELWRRPVRGDRTERQMERITAGGAIPLVAKARAAILG